MSKQEKAEAAQLAKDEKKQKAEEKKSLAAEAKAAAKAARKQQAAQRAEKWQNERDESVTGWQDFKYKAALYSQTAKHRLEIPYLQRQVCLFTCSAWTYIILRELGEAGWGRTWPGRKCGGGLLCRTNVACCRYMSSTSHPATPFLSTTTHLWCLNYAFPAAQLLVQKRVMGAMLFDQLDEDDKVGAEETFLQCKKSVDALLKQLAAKEAELKRLEEDGKDPMKIMVALQYYFPCFKLPTLILLGSFFLRGGRDRGQARSWKL
jgi:hypothetical protein